MPAPVLQLDGSSGKLLETLHCTGDTRADYLGFGPDGRLYVSNLSPSNASRFDVDTDQCLGKYPNPNGGEIKDGFGKGFLFRPSKRMSQSIDFPPILHQTQGWGGTVALSATASSGLPVTIVSLTPAFCKVSGMTLALKAAGICTLKAVQAGDAVYIAAPSVTQTFSIWRNRQKITFEQPPHQPQGPGGTVPLVATASSGVPVGFTSLTPAICGVSGSNATLLAPGICTIQANEPKGNYLYLPATPVSQSFSIWH